MNTLSKDKLYFQDVLITSMYQVAIAAIGFTKATTETWQIVTGVAIFIMPIMVFLKGKYFYKLF